MLVALSLVNRLHIANLPIKSKIGLIYLKGTITSNTVEDFIPLLKEAERRPDIKGIIIRINSPGGAVAPSQEIYHYILKLRKKKRIYASVETIGASGAYYVASACNKIFADSGSLVGSIGVIFSFAEVRDLLNRVGIKPYVFKSGKFKDLGSPFKEPTEEEKKVIKGLLDNIHEQFIRDVAKARGMKEEDVRRVADGRVFTGNEALSLKLIDGIATLDDVVGIMSKDLGYKGRLEVTVIEKKYGFMERLKAETLSFIREMKAEIIGGLR
ncbi:MAG: signal peptide peptidase SppA [Deferribacteres bacterium]|nr:signal peptide peptidase SppA [Deferribacteres bacterium]